MKDHSDQNYEQLAEQNLALREQIEDYEQLHKVLAAVGTALQVEEVIRQIVEETLDLLQADQGSVMLFDPAGKTEARTLIRQGDSEDEILDHFLNMMLTGWVSQHQKPLLTDNPAETIGKDFMKEKYRTVVSVISMPLNLSGEQIGILNIIRTAGKPPFTGRELRLLNILAPTFAHFIRHAKFHDTIFQETIRLRKEVQAKYAYHGIIGQSSQLKRVFALLDRVIPTDVRVLIEGESGTGKELVAKVIHYSGPRKDEPFVAIDCGALPATLLEGELFGYQKGAFTGAHRDKKGLFEVASRGTLFLDEIINMPLEIQSKFLRAIQEGEIRPLGSTQVKKVDVRIISAASTRLREHADAGKFRQDLYYRLNVVTVPLPPLRERKGDIAILANHFLEKMARRHNKEIRGFRPETMAHMEGYAWPGNVRELENMIERMVILIEDDQDYVPIDVLPMEIRPLTGDGAPAAPVNSAASDIRGKRASYEKMMLIEALANHNWNQSAAARELGISERTVRYKMKKYDIRRP